MSAISRLPLMAGTLSFGAFIAAITTIPSLRQRFGEALDKLPLSISMLRALAVVFAVANIKNLPFMWHFRVFKGIIYQIYFNRHGERTPRTLFAPMVTSSYNSILDCDYNLHKSNSTYFADLDVARAHYVGSIIRTGLARLNSGDEEGLPPQASGVKAVKGKYIIALGAVGCFFQREIEPLKQFDVYTRLLSWDKKWMYIVSHIVKKGSVKPDSYALQPWKQGKRRGAQEKEAEQDLKKHIYATSIARYVVKKGRLTINPEIILERSRLLPRRPAGTGLPPRAEASSEDETPVYVETPQTNGIVDSSPEQVAAAVSSKLGGSVDNAGEVEDWSWEEMEEERLRGLKMASHFDKLSGLHDEIRAGEVLGQYSDWF